MRYSDSDLINLSRDVAKGKRQLTFRETADMIDYVLRLRKHLRLLNQQLTEATQLDLLKPCR